MELSIVIPVYNSKQGLDELYTRISKVLKKLDLSYEIILVDDCSTDDSYEKMIQLNNIDNRVKIIQLMRNFGQHTALICGMNHSSGDYLITMDDDLQNPPEEIPNLLNEINKGYDCIIGKAVDKKHARYRNFGSFIIGKSYEKIFGKPRNIKMSSFRILSRPLVESLISYKAEHPMIDALILKNTNKIANIEVEHDHRKYGVSNYSLKKSYKLAMDLLVNYSTIPLQFISSIGFLFSGIGAIIVIYVIVGKILGWISAVGWSSIVALICIFSGLILISFGIVGEYLIRIISQVSFFQQYAVRHSSFEEEASLNKRKDIVG
ncbi:glycosyltransferase family 2 protein [Paenibacillus silagei]|uniref:Glycosyltransferase involved in cell wall biosynthesis n=1 Tax=Paenibacillus silagei TaxID=1670801 RepID=A0ABS4NIL5_9BACL|nr:glycosyltransferase involved in cell wall biosynthesis [Paenibacillus silagei]